MADLLRWLIAVEVLGLCFLPLTVWAMRWLPDRGYAFSKILGLLLVTYVTWLIGDALPIARSAVLPGAVAIVAACIGWWMWRNQTLAALLQARRAVLIEEALFIGGVALLSYLRVYTFGSGIGHTEQFMDMALMNASYHSASYPPFDPWMSGHSLNYYYFGYLAFATLTKLAGVMPTVGYNLALSTIFGLVLAGAYSIVQALTRRLIWPLLGPAFVACIGNWHAMLWTSGHGTPCSSDPFWGSLWESTRVIGSQFTLANWASGPPWAQLQPCTIPNATISEYPLFSFVLGDLHPHVMALPFVLLVIALGVACIYSDRRLRLERSADAIGRLLVLAIAVGALFAINSWDFPAYLAVAAACVLTNAYLLDERDDWWKEALGAVIVLAIASVVVFLPYYLQFHSATHGIGRVATTTDAYEFLQIFGLFLLVGSLFVLSLSLLLQPAGDEEDTEETIAALASETGEAQLGFAGGSSRSGLITTVIIALLAVAAILLHLTVLLLLAVLALSGLTILRRVLNTEEPNRGDAAALIFIMLGCAIVAVTELVYLRDSFDASTMYRMNTVFKLYYQGWVLLGLGAAYGVFRAWGILRQLYSPLYGWLALAVVAAGMAGAGTYTVWAFQARPSDASAASIDGAAYLSVESAGDATAITWLRDHVGERSVVLEAVGTPESPGGDYSSASRISTFSGLPTVMGWVGHEQQWRGDIAEITNRSKDVATIYTTADQRRTKSLLHKYAVRYVVVGDAERRMYVKSLATLDKFGSFMRIVYHARETTIYTWK